MNRTVICPAGKLTGVMSGIQKYTLFKGVPYAKPPIGDLRWRAPQKLDSQIEKTCDTFSSAAMQGAFEKGSFYEIEFYQGGVETSEDCLYLNIWADLEKRNQPVMLWIHGGAYMHGFGHEMEFDGDAIAKRGVILITINYRVGAFGFMAHPALTARDGHSGNYGLLDQIAALQWVRENIAAFGGDPENITIFGQSAGGGSVQALMASPLAKGLFKRAIIQSAGSPLTSLGGGYALADAEKTGLEMGGDISALYELSADEILEKCLKLRGEGLRFRPCVDGYALPTDPGEVFKSGAAYDESLMLGSVTGDAGLFCGENDIPDELAETATIALAKSRVKLNKSGCYVYHFKREIPGDDHPGAFHSSELWYVFGTLARSNRPFDGADYDMSNYLTDRWTSFARVGDPGDIWRPFTARDSAILEIGASTEMVDVSERPTANKLSDEIIEEVYG